MKLRRTRGVGRSGGGSAFGTGLMLAGGAAFGALILASAARRQKEQDQVRYDEPEQTGEDDWISVDEVQVSRLREPGRSAREVLEQDELEQEEPQPIAAEG